MSKNLLALDRAICQHIFRSGQWYANPNKKKCDNDYRSYQIEKSQIISSRMKNVRQAEKRKR